jgi:hypothetical protein
MPDSDKHTPLHLACIDGSIRCVNYLLQVCSCISNNNLIIDALAKVRIRLCLCDQHGADPTIPDYSDKTCVDIAQDLGRRDIQEAVKHVRLPVSRSHAPLSIRVDSDASETAGTGTRTGTGTPGPSPSCSPSPSSASLSMSSVPSPSPSSSACDHWTVIVSDTMLTDVAGRVIIFPSR